MTMKRLLRSLVLAAAVFAFAWHAPAATVTKGYTFSTNEQVTATKLHTLVDSATVSSITGADITDGSVAAVDLGANSVITAKIQDGAVTAGKLGALAVETAKIATNAVGTTQLATNLDLSAKVLTLATNQIPSIALVSTNAGPGTAGQVPLLDSSGLIAASLLPAVGVTNAVIASDIVSGTTMTNLVSIADSTASGRYVAVFGQAALLTDEAGGDPASWSVDLLAISGATTNYLGAVVGNSDVAGGAGLHTLAVMGVHTTTTNATTYVLRGRTNTGTGDKWVNGGTDAGSNVMTNGTKMILIR